MLQALHEGNLIPGAEQLTLYETSEAAKYDRTVGPVMDTEEEYRQRAGMRLPACLPAC